MVSGEPFGNPCMTEKLGGDEFSERDEDVVELLAEFVGVAIDHARRSKGLEPRHSELRRTVDVLDATMRFARAVGDETDLGTIFGLVAKRGRELVSARTLVIEHEHQRGDWTGASG
jgi:two-component system, NarL family, sensor histidine kinase DevS